MLGGGKPLKLRPKKIPFTNHTTEQPVPHCCGVRRLTKKPGRINGTLEDSQGPAPISDSATGEGRSLRHHPRTVGDTSPPKGILKKNPAFDWYPSTPTGSSGWKKKKPGLAQKFKKLVGWSPSSGPVRGGRLKHSPRKIITKKQAGICWLAILLKILWQQNHTFWVGKKWGEEICNCWLARPNSGWGPESLSSTLGQTLGAQRCPGEAGVGETDVGNDLSTSGNKTRLVRSPHSSVNLFGPNFSRQEEGWK